MDLRSLIMESMYEAEDPQRAAYDKFKADDAKQAAIEQVKKMTTPNGESNFIDPKDGIIKYQDRAGMGGQGNIREFPYDWYMKGQEGQFFNVLKTAGLEVKPVEKKQLFGTSQVAGVDLTKLATLGQAAPAPAADASAPAATTQSVPEPSATPTTGNAATREKLAALLDKLEKTISATPQAAKPAPSKQLLPVNPSVQAFQQEVLKIDPKAFPKFGADGRKGAEVIQAIAKYPAIAQKYKLTQQAANPAPAAATSAGPADQNVDQLGNIINTGVMPESVNYKDDQILLAIKNIKY